MRIAKREVYRSIQDSIAEIKSASGGDRRTSAREMKLHPNLVGWKEVVTMKLYDTLDKMDARPGASVSAAKLQKLEQWARTTLVDQFDKNGNGLSIAERNAMSHEGYAAVAMAEERLWEAKHGADPLSGYPYAVGFPD